MAVSPTPPAAAAPASAPTPGAAVEAVQLRKDFGPIHAVDGIDMSLPPGSIYGLLGPNGSGKTTLIRLLTGLASATSGTARVLGVAMPSRTNLARIGYMTQSDGIYPELSVWENLTFFAALYGQTDKVDLLRTLELVELDKRTGTPALQLSGGMRRRLSMACALAHHPQVIFLDEPTVGVDPALRVQFWDHFHRLAAGGATLVVSSHVMDEADRCDQLLFIRDGRVLAQGTPAELRQRAGTDNLETAFLSFATQIAGSPAAFAGAAPKETAR
ncbi:MAG: ABC transporter ATP-binding protein [Candidatus Limnocylindrales bacterium]|jgi:ABC-2 type transport system ATP-binding protein